MPFSEARGPTNARHLAATLYRNEDYFFQIDSHTSFRQASCQRSGCNQRCEGCNEHALVQDSPAGIWLDRTAGYWEPDQAWAGLSLR